MFTIKLDWATDPLALQAVAQQWGLVDDDNAPFSLGFYQQCLQLHKRDEPKLGGVYVDFTSATMAYRRQFGGGRGEAIAKAVGLKKTYYPTVVDATAGLGRDAFILAALGCQVSMVERHPVVAALLADGLQRAYQHHTMADWLPQRLRLLPITDFRQLLSQASPAPDVVYLDPMFPHKNKSALVKKEMRLFQLLIGADEDAEKLLLPARQLASKRVVVKRPSYAPPLANIVALSAIVSKKHRFDLYQPLVQSVIAE